jgi:hypothetical protein
MGEEHLSEKNELHHELALTAIAAFPTLEEAAEYMWENHEIRVSVAKLEVYRDGRFKEDYLKHRDEFAAKFEKDLANNLLDTAARATAVTQLAVAQTAEMLAQGKIKDPSKVARDLSQVATQAIDKRLALQGRPTHVVETRNTEEILRKLEAMGVAKRFDAEGTADEVPVLSTPDNGR